MNISYINKLKGIARDLTLGRGLIIAAFFSFVLTGCIDESTPTSVVSEKEVQEGADTPERLLNGISSYMVAYNSWGSSTYYLNDWGFPCQMFYREVCGEDFPIYKSTYNYWTYHENAAYSSTYTYTCYSWYYYYRLIRNCNNLIRTVDENTTSTDLKHYLGSGLAFRAMAYMDLARLFEFKPTGVDSLDTQAKNDGLWGLTVPIVTDNTTEASGIDNPRVDYCTMWRFIMTDLKKAKSLLGSYNPSDKSLPGSSVVSGLMARAWMEIGSRIAENSKYISGYAEKFAESDKSKDGYTTLGVSNATECYEQAIACANDAMKGFTPVTEAEWLDGKTGFNTANEGWMWRCRIGGKEQEPVYYCSFLGQIASEPLAGLAYSYDAYRCISDTLYNNISNKDWRKLAWVAPTDAGKSSEDMVTKYSLNLSAKQFKKLPAYANLKFRPGSGNIDDYITWMVSDLPVMRVEEMYFIKAEAEARISGFAAGQAVLKKLLDTRYTDGSYKSPSDIASLDDFIKKELMMQKRIEFWGEGICFFDYKRLNLQIDRSIVGNYESSFQIVSNANSTAPWMNFYIPRQETQRNTACKANPDVAGKYTK